MPVAQGGLVPVAQDRLVVVEVPSTEEEEPRIAGDGGEGMRAAQSSRGPRDVVAGGQQEAGSGTEAGDSTLGFRAAIRTALFG